MSSLVVQQSLTTKYHIVKSAVRTSASTLKHKGYSTKKDAVFRSPFKYHQRFGQYIKHHNHLSKHNTFIRRSKSDANTVLCRSNYILGNKPLLAGNQSSERSCYKTCPMVNELLLANNTRHLHHLHNNMVYKTHYLRSTNHQHALYGKLISRLGNDMSMFTDQIQQRSYTTKHSNNIHENDPRIARQSVDEDKEIEHYRLIYQAYEEGYMTAEANKGPTLFEYAIVFLIRNHFSIIVILVITYFSIDLALNEIYLDIKKNIIGDEKYKKLAVLDEKKFEVVAEKIGVTFKDVKGAEEAKEELKHIVNFLKHPEKYTSLGARLPRGVLLSGPPGVGKTLLARAMAGEADVPFYHVAGSEFDLMYVGVGAERVRQLFSAAKKNTPCIIFIDEFESVGRKRSSSAKHPNANQTVNQLLTEMDGLHRNEGVIVVGATNLVGLIDIALRRPGRFDTEVNVALPHLKEREEILNLYISKIKKHPMLDTNKLARGTPGFSGAELKNLVNQAALKAVLDQQESVTSSHFDYAKDKITMGPERKHRVLDEARIRQAAYHEAGHTLVAHYTGHATPLHKVTVIPRGQSEGHTAFIHDKEQHNQSLAHLKAAMDVALGGRVAEELVYGRDHVSTTSSHDLQTASRVAKEMVTVYGMSERVGLRVVVGSKLSPALKEMIDTEINHQLEASHLRASSILTTNSKELTNLAEALIKHETLDREQVKQIIEKTKAGGK